MDVADKDNAAAPEADKHDGESGNAGKEHCHDRSRTDKMGANFVRIESEVIGANATSCEMKAGVDLIAGEETKVAAGGEVGIDKNSLAKVPG
jgi:hypothetical protein